MRTAGGRLAIAALGLLLAGWLPAEPPPRPRYPKPVRVEEVRHLAGQHTPLAPVMEAGKDSPAPSHWLDWNRGGKARRDLLAKVRELAVEELRNQNVAAALELYWKLAAALEKCRLLALGKDELQAQLARLDEAIAKELKAPRDRDDLALKLSKLHSDELTLRAGLEQLQDQLALLTGTDRAVPPAFQPTTPLTVHPEAIDPAAAFAVACQTRPDLRLLRLLEQELDGRTLPVVQRWMTTISPLLGPMQLKTLLEMALRVLNNGQGNDPEVSDVRKQVQQLRALRERQIRLDVHRQVEIIQLKYQDAIQTRHRWEIQRQRLASVQEKADQEMANEADLGAVRPEVWRAEAEMIQAAIDWELARIELCKLQGTLAAPVVEAPPPPPAVVVPVAAPAGPTPFPPAFTPPAGPPAGGRTHPR